MGMTEKHSAPWVLYGPVAPTWSQWCQLGPSVAGWVPVLPAGAQFSIPSQHITLNSWENMQIPHEPLFQQHFPELPFPGIFLAGLKRKRRNPGNCVICISTAPPMTSGVVGPAAVDFFFNVIHLFRFSTFAPFSKRSKSKATLV